MRAEELRAHAWKLGSSRAACPYHLVPVFNQSTGNEMQTHLAWRNGDARLANISRSDVAEVAAQCGNGRAHQSLRREMRHRKHVSSIERRENAFKRGGSWCGRRRPKM